MAAIAPQTAVQEIDDVLKWFEKGMADGGFRIEGTAMMQSMFVACIDRLAPPNSIYRAQARSIVGQFPTPFTQSLGPLRGLLAALRVDYIQGRMRSFEELIHADLFSDFVEMARHLVAEGYKDAAAVIAGSTLEGHLRQLCTKNGIQVRDTAGKPVKASRLNDDLAKASVYSGGSDQKQVTAWLAVRNDAAHGNYGAYTKDQAALMIDGVADFLTRNPA